MDYKNLDLPYKSTEGRPKVAMVFAGGGATCNVYIGIYEVLVKYKFPIDIITGTSAGAMFGAGIAIGKTPSFMRNKMVKLAKKGIVNMDYFNYFKESLFTSEGFQRHIYDSFGDLTFQDTKIPFGCGAVNIESGKKLEIISGYLKDAILASMSLPVIFPPVYLNNRYLVDGGLLDNTPAMLARKLGADKLIVFRISSNYIRQKISGRIFNQYLVDQTINRYDGINKFIKYFSFRKDLKDDLDLFLDIAYEVMSIAPDYISRINIKEAKPDIIFNIALNSSSVNIDQEEVLRHINIGRKFAEKNIDKILAIVNG